MRSPLGYKDRWMVEETPEERNPIPKLNPQDKGSAHWGCPLGSLLAWLVLG